MLLACKTTIRLTEDDMNIIGHMCFAARKLWNVLNYERRNYKELGLEEYPNWYYQKKTHKDNMWYKNLPSQTAQEVCKLLDKGWKSFFALKKSGGIENPRPPRFKQENIPVTYMQNGIKHEIGSRQIRLALSKSLKSHMLEKYGIDANYLFIENKIFCDIDTIKQVTLYPPENGECNAIVVYETPDIEMLKDNGHYLSIDLGVHNFLTCLDSADGNTFIVGRKYLALCHYFNKELARIQSQWHSLQAKQGVRYPKDSKHIKKLYKQKNNAIRNYLHKMIKAVVDYCVEHDIHTVVIGDITGIRKNANHGHVNNQKLHSLPYAKVYTLLTYKLAKHGISLIKQKESYSSQCSPLSPEVSKEYAQKKNRKHRGLYIDGKHSWNADCVGAYNILRLYLEEKERECKLLPLEIKMPTILKVAV